MEDSCGLIVADVRRCVEITSRHIFLKKNEKRHPIYPTPVKNTENLEKKIKRNIDLVSRNGIKEKYFRQIENELVYV